MWICLTFYVCLKVDPPICLLFYWPTTLRYWKHVAFFREWVWVNAECVLGRWMEHSWGGNSLEVQVHEWQGWTSLSRHQSCTSSVSVVEPSKSCVLRGSGDTVYGLCALVSGSHSKGYYTTVAQVFAVAPGAWHDPSWTLMVPKKGPNIKFL